MRFIKFALFIVFSLQITHVDAKKATFVELSAWGSYTYQDFISFGSKYVVTEQGTAYLDVFDTELSGEHALIMQLKFDSDVSKVFEFDNKLGVATESAVTLYEVDEQWVLTEVYSITVDTSEIAVSADSEKFYVARQTDSILVIGKDNGSYQIEANIPYQDPDLSFRSYEQIITTGDYLFLLYRGEVDNTNQYILDRYGLVDGEFINYFPLGNADISDIIAVDDSSLLLARRELYATDTLDLHLLDFSEVEYQELSFMRLNDAGRSKLAKDENYFYTTSIQTFNTLEIDGLNQILLVDSERIYSALGDRNSINESQFIFGQVFAISFRQGLFSIKLAQGAFSAFEFFINQTGQVERGDVVGENYLLPRQDRIDSLTINSEGILSRNGSVELNADALQINNDELIVNSGGTLSSVTLYPDFEYVINSSQSVISQSEIQLIYDNRLYRVEEDFIVDPESLEPPVTYLVRYNVTNPLSLFESPQLLELAVNFEYCAVLKGEISAYLVIHDRCENAIIMVDSETFEVTNTQYIQPEFFPDSDWTNFNPDIIVFQDFVLTFDHNEVLMLSVVEEGQLNLHSTIPIAPSGFSSIGKFHDASEHLLLSYAFTLFIFELSSGQLELVSQQAQESFGYTFSEFDMFDSYALVFDRSGSHPLRVHEVNLAPQASVVTVTLDEDSEFSSETMFTDPENDEVTPSVVENAINGFVEVSEALVTYTPSQNYNGDDSFVLKGLDIHGNFTQQEIVVSVTPINDAPELLTESIELSEDTKLEQTLEAIDVEGDSISFLLASEPTQGVAHISDSGELVYQPADNFYGTDEFSVSVFDPADDFTESVVKVVITSVNDIPTMAPQVFSTKEDEFLDDVIEAADIEDDSLEFSLVEPPQNGEVVLQLDGQFSYVPDLNFNGIDRFSLQVSDGQDDSEIVEMTIEVEAVNDAPLLVSETFNVDEDAQLDAILEATDQENHAISFTLLSQPENGVAEVSSAGDMSYVPTEDFTGTDILFIGLTDSLGLSSTGSVRINVNSINDLPELISSLFEHNEDTILEVSLDAQDIDNDLLKFSLSETSYAEGSLTLSVEGQLRFTPNLDYNGSLSVDVLIQDASLESVTGTFLITTLAIDDPPVISTQTFTTSSGTAISNSLPTEDVDGDTLNYTLVEIPANGTAQLESDGKFTYNPNIGFSGSDKFTFEVTDGVNTTSGEVNLRISAPLPLPSGSNGSGGGSSNIVILLMLAMAIFIRNRKAPILSIKT